MGNLKEEYTFIRINDNEYARTKELYLKSFGIEQSLEAIRHKYDTNSSGIKNIGYFAIAADGSTAAYYGVFPCRFLIHGKDVLCAQSGDTMTAPAHQGRGLFTRLAKMTYDLAQQQGVRFVFGFPNDNSYPGFKNKLNWKFYGNMKLFSFTNNTLPFCEISSKIAVSRPFYSFFSKWRIQKNVTMLNAQSASYFIDKGHPHLLKDLAFFKHKLTKSGVYLVSINEFVMLVKIADHLIIGDVAFFNKNRSDEFISSIKKLGTKLLCRKTLLHLNQNHWLYGYIAEKSTCSDSLPIGFYEIDNTILYKDMSFIGGDFDTF